MSQIAELSETEIEDRFYITGQTPIQFMLSGFADHGEPFTVRFQEGKTEFLTVLLGVQPDKGKLFFDCSGSLETNRQFLASEAAVFVARPGGIHVQFSTGKAHEVLFGGSSAFAVTLPNRLMRRQRREDFRIETPRARPLQFTGRLADGKSVTLPTHDISLAGIGLSATSLPENLTPGTLLSKCHFALPDDPRALLVDVLVHHLTEQVGRGGLRQWRIGLAFVKLGHAEENRIQRYISRVEHERRELS